MISRTWQAYAQLLRLDKPIAYLLLLWPTLWGLWIASDGIPSTRLLIIFVMGVFIMRSAGCIINDMVDKDIDPHVERTQLRPLASGTLSMTAAMLILLLLLSMAFILVMQLNHLCLVIAVVGVVLTLIYPWLKRITHFPQVVLGIVFGGIAPLMAFAAVDNQLTVTAWWLFVTAALWPIAYDTIYAMCDQKDDQKIGVHSLALYFGTKAPQFVMLVHAVMLSSLLWLGDYLQFNGWYYLGLLGAVVCIALQWQLMRTQQTAQIFRAFQINHWQGMSIFLGIFLAMWH